MRSKEKARELRDLEDVLDLFAGRWRGAILTCLSEKSRGFNELKRELSPITSRVLVRDLRYLEQNKLIVRDSERQKKYQLSNHGMALRPLMKEMISWAQLHRRVIVHSPQSSALENMVQDPSLVSQEAMFIHS